MALLTKTRRRWHTPVLGTLAVYIAAATLVIAQSSFERELAQLKEQRELAKAAVVEPIERRYQASLEQLMRRATQSSDLETAMKVKEELDKFPGANDPRNTPLELMGSWELADPINNARLGREFKPNGKLISDAPPGGKWTINGNKLILTYNDPQAVDTFELPIRNHVLTGVSKAKHALTLTKLPPK